MPVTSSVRMTDHIPTRGKIRMAKRGKSSVLLVGVIAASLISAPIAEARQTGHDAGGVVRCETNGSVSIKTVPTTRAPQAGQGWPSNRGRSGIILSW